MHLISEQLAHNYVAKHWGVLLSKYIVAGIPSRASATSPGKASCPGWELIDGGWKDRSGSDTTFLNIMLEKKNPGYLAVWCRKHLQRCCVINATLCILQWSTSACRFIVTQWGSEGQMIIMSVFLTYQWPSKHDFRVSYETLPYVRVCWPLHLRVRRGFSLPSRCWFGQQKIRY